MIDEHVGSPAEQRAARGIIRLEEGRALAGPSPFRFDYFSLLTGFSYIAPGATFIDAGTLLSSGGFDRRFPYAATFGFLLRTGPMYGVAALTEPVLETDADPFPGVPRDYAPRLNHKHSRAIGAVRSWRSAICASVIGMNVRAISMFSSSWAIVSQPTMTVLTG